MKLICHIIKKDFRRLRLPLALWLLPMAGQFLIGFWLLRAHDPTPFALEALGRTLAVRNLAGCVWLLWGLQVVGCGLLVVALVQADPLVGGQIWWVSRPISPARLLSAKLLALALFCCLPPVVVALPWWLFCGYGPREILLATGETMAGHAVLVVLVLPLAVLTENAARFMFHGLVAFFFWVCLLLLLAAWWPPVDEPNWAALGWAVVPAVVVTLHQYLCRRTARSWLLLAAGMVVIGLAPRLVPPTPGFWRDNPFAFAISGPPREAPPAMATLTVTPGTVSLWKFSPANPAEVPQTDATVRLRFGGLPVGYAIFDGQYDGTWRWPDGVQFQQAGSIYGDLDPAAWSLLGRPDPKDPGEAGMASVFVPDSLATKIKRQPTAWDARLHLGVMRGEVVALLPLRAGAVGGRSGHQIRILEVQRPGALELTMVDLAPAFMGGNWQNLFYTLDWDERTSFYALRSRTRTGSAGQPTTSANILKGQSEQPEAKAIKLPHGGVTLAIRIGTVGLLCRLVEVEAWEVADGNLASADQGKWLDDAELVQVAFTRVGTIERAVATKALVVQTVKAGTLGPAEKP